MIEFDNLEEYLKCGLDFTDFFEREIFDYLLKRDGKLIYNDKAYSEGDDFLGYKIYKLTPIYVKLEDEEKEIRKQFIFKK